MKETAQASGLDSTVFGSFRWDPGWVRKAVENLVDKETADAWMQPAEKKEEKFTEFLLLLLEIQNVSEK